MSASAWPVCVVGSSHAASTCTIGLAQLGWRVHASKAVRPGAKGAERDDRELQQSAVPEPFTEHSRRGRVRFFEHLEAAASSSKIVIVAVEAVTSSDNSGATGQLEATIELLSTVPFASRPTLVLRATMPPGRSAQLAASVAAWADLVYAPSFLGDGAPTRDFLTVDRILVGCDQPSKCVPYVNLLERLQKPVLITSFRNAELIACCANAYLAMSVSFANEVERLCEALGAASDDVLRGVGYAHNSCAKLLRPGITLDASSFDKDVSIIESAARKHGLAHELFSGILRVRDAQPHQVVDLLESEIGLLARKTIGVWGLAQRPAPGDVTGSQALRIVELLSERGATTVVYDPSVQVVALPARSRLTPSALEATNVDALLVLTAWPEFSQIDPLRYAGKIASRVMVDACKILDPTRVSAAGLLYRSLGRALPQSRIRQ